MIVLIALDDLKVWLYIVILAYFPLFIYLFSMREGEEGKVLFIIIVCIAYTLYHFNPYTTNYDGIYDVQ